PGRLDRQNRDDPQVARIDDDQFILIDEVEETAPCRLEIHEHPRHRDDVDAAAWNDRPHRQVEVDVADPRRAVRADDRLPELRALFVREGHMGGIALQALQAVAPRPVFGDGGAGGARASYGHASFLLGLSGSAAFKVALLATVDLLGLLSRRGRAHALWRRGLAEALHALGGLLGGRFSVWGRLLHAHLVPARLGVLAHVARARLWLRARGCAALHRLRGSLRLLSGLLLLGRGKTGPGHQREGGDTR